MKIYQPPKDVPIHKYGAFDIGQLGTDYIHIDRQYIGRSCLACGVPYTKAFIGYDYCRPQFSGVVIRREDHAKLKVYLADRDEVVK